MKVSEVVKKMYINDRVKVITKMKGIKGKKSVERT